MPFSGMKVDLRPFWKSIHFERVMPSSARILPFVPRGGLTFGIFHGGAIQSHHELATGKPDAADEVNSALDRLQNGNHLVVRTYLRFTGTEADTSLQAMPTFSDLARYTSNGRKLDLVLCNWDPAGNMSRWSLFIEQVIARYGGAIENLQICEEPNRFNYPGDGRFSHSVEAVVTGVRAAREALRKSGLRASVGFNAVPPDIFNDGFWRGLSDHLDQSFMDALDYVGLNLFIDVEDPLVGPVEDAVEKELVHFREISLVEAGIPAIIPLHISECGWPTGPHRFYTRQADILQAIVRKVHALRHRLNITHFELFSLRDADTANPDVAHQFGIMRDDYMPKPAFEAYRQLIQELGD